MELWIFDPNLKIIEMYWACIVFCRVWNPATTDLPNVQGRDSINSCLEWKPFQWPSMGSRVPSDVNISENLIKIVHFWFRDKDALFSNCIWRHTWTVRLEVPKCRGGLTFGYRHVALAAVLTSFALLYRCKLEDFKQAWSAWTFLHSSYD